MINTVNQEMIDRLMEKAEISVETIYGKCTVVTIQLKNGFVIVESSACVDSNNYDETMGKQICIERIKSKLWELEGYKLQCEIFGGDNK